MNKVVFLNFLLGMAINCFSQKANDTIKNAPVANDSIYMIADQMPKFGNEMNPAAQDFINPAAQDL